MYSSDKCNCKVTRERCKQSLSGKTVTCMPSKWKEMMWNRNGD